MSVKKLTLGYVAAVCLSLLATSTTVAEENDWLSITLEQSEATAKIEHALGESTTLEFIETPLSDTVAYLSDVHDINIQLDARALDAVGIGGDTPITRYLKGISLRSALRIMLADLELTYVIADEVLLITTEAEAQKRTEIRVYRVDGLLAANDDADEVAVVLSDALKENSPAGPVARDIHAPPATSHRRITAYEKLLIVQDTTAGHRRITNLLKAMQRGVEATRPVETGPTIIQIPDGPMDPGGDDPADDTNADPNEGKDSQDGA